MWKEPSEVNHADAMLFAPGYDVFPGLLRTGHKSGRKNVGRIPVEFLGPRYDCNSNAAKTVSGQIGKTLKHRIIERKRTSERFGGGIDRNTDSWPAIASREEAYHIVANQVEQVAACQQEAIHWHRIHKAA